MCKKANLKIGSLALALTLVAGAAGAEYPDRTVTLLVNFGAGGGTDSVARVFQPAFEKAMGETVVIKNVAGASGTVGVAELASSKSNGYTVGYFPLGATTVQMYMRDLPYQKEDLVPVCRVTSQPVILFTTKSSSWNSLEDFIKAAKEKPRKYAYGSSGVGTTPHISMAAASHALGIDLKHVPANGSAAAVKDLMGGVTHVHADPPVMLERYEGKPLAFFSDNRVVGYEDVPTLKELGYDLTFSIWQGLFVPKGTPKDVITKIAAACKTASGASSFLNYNKTMNFFPDFLDTKDFETFYAREYETAGSVLKKAGLLKKK